MIFLEIIIAPTAGFCYGVKKAVDCVYNLKYNATIYTYGNLINNKIVIDQLDKIGIKSTYDLDEISKNKGMAVIRSHGVAPEIYQSLTERDIEFVDCSCPHVKKIHDIVEKEVACGREIIIIGDSKHPEVIGINGWANHLATVFETSEEAKNIHFQEDKKYSVVVQTTFRTEKFNEISNVLKQKNLDIKIYNTICNATKKRQDDAVELAKKVDKMIVLGDKGSSNTQKLFEICKLYCENTFYVETIQDLELNIFHSNDKIGITAGASTPSAIIKEAVKAMNELENQVEENNNQTFEEMLNQSFVTIHNGDIVKGTVIQVSNIEVSVNLGYKSDGIITRSEFSDDTSLDLTTAIKVGDEIETVVLRVNDGDGNVQLSKKRIDSLKGLDDIEEAFKNKTLIKGKIIDIVKGGLIAIVNGIRVFVPSSQISNRYVDDLNSFKGHEYSFAILEYDRTKRRIVAGRKEIAEKELNEKKDKLFATLEVGQKITAKVSRLADFGAFVDLEGVVDGLIHISEISWGRVKHPKDVLKVGQEVTVVVLDFSREKSKISLTLKDVNNDPWKAVNEKYAIGSVVEGRVVRITPFGVFVELETGVDGLVHISQISNKHVAKPEDVLKINDVIKVKVLDINNEQKRISLSKKEAEAPVAEEEVEETESK